MKILPNVQFMYEIYGKMYNNLCMKCTAECMKCTVECIISIAIQTCGYLLNPSLPTVPCPNKGIMPHSAIWNDLGNCRV